MFSRVTSQVRKALFVVGIAMIASCLMIGNPSAAEATPTTHAESTTPASAAKAKRCVKRTRARSHGRKRCANRRSKRRPPKAPAPAAAPPANPSVPLTEAGAATPDEQRPPEGNRVDLIDAINYANANATPGTSLVLTRPKPEFLGCSYWEVRWGYWTYYCAWRDASTPHYVQLTWRYYVWLDGQVQYLFTQRCGVVVSPNACTHEIE